MPGLRYLLDTTWAIDYLKGDPEKVQKINGLLPQGIGISIVSMAELYQGWEGSARTRQREEQTLNALLGSITVVPLDDPTCRIFAREWQRLRTIGQSLGDPMDLFIGSTAICHGLILLTDDRHFDRMDGIQLLEAE
jgi:predicted nucleic acid-binding protein